MFIKIPDNGITHKVTILGLGHTTGKEPGFKKDVSNEDFIRYVLSNKAREELFGHQWPYTDKEIKETAKEWEEKTGVGSRTLFYGETWRMGYFAAVACLEHAGVNIGEIDGIISGTNTPGDPRLENPRDQGFPSPADFIKNELALSESVCGGKSDAFCVNMQEACTTAAPAIFLAYGAIRAGLCKKILLVFTENCMLLTHPDKWKEGSNLFGAGASAILLSASEDTESFLFFELTCDPYGENLSAICCDVNDANNFTQRGKDVLNYVAGTMPRNLKDAFARVGIDPEQLAFLIPHQPSGRLIKKFKENIKARWPEFKGKVTEERGVGNISCASTIMMLSKLVHDGTIKTNIIATLAPFGAGLSGGIIGIKIPLFKRSN